MNALSRSREGFLFLVWTDSQRTRSLTLAVAVVGRTLFALLFRFAEQREGGAEACAFGSDEGVGERLDRLEELDHVVEAFVVGFDVVG